MKLTVYMAISIDGLTTRGDTDSDWVSKSDWDQFYSYINANDAVIMGRKTMEQFGEDFPIEGPLNVVLSRNKDIQKNEEKLIITNSSPKELIELIEAKNLSNVLLIGGSDVNQQFIESSLVDEIVLSVHPLVIGNGMQIFGNKPLNTKLELIDTKSINDELVQIRYKVIK